MRRGIAILVSFVFIFGTIGLTGCGNSGGNPEPEYSEEYKAFAENVDMDFALEVNEKIASFGDDENTGMRSAGSPAETKTADYIQKVMEDIGLETVTKDDIQVDGWTFSGADITFKDAKGKKVKAVLGGYQTTINADNQKVEIVYVNRGTEEDYEGLDVEGKLVLFEINQEEDWWINYPAYQAKAKGALCAIAMREFAQEDEEGNRIGVQDICGPSDAPALAISRNDCEAIKEAIKSSGKDSIKVKFNADSAVTENATSHNVWGEIPGVTDETIFVFSHMDGYFYSAYDDAQGVAISLAIAKGIIDSGYKPEKTIRFCVHGSEEWGREGSEYDWSTGAYEEIVNLHPEWIEGGFCIVNNDGGYTVEGEEYKGTRSTPELKSFIKSSIGEMNEAGKYKWNYMDPSTGTEDFMWARLGIPAIVAADGKGTKYDDVGYHSNYDSWEYLPLDEEGYQEMIETFGKLVMDLDEIDVRPMNFTARLKAFDKSIDREYRDMFDEVLTEGYAAADALSSKMEDVEKSDDKEGAMKLNENIQDIYIALQDAILGLNFDPDVCIKHDLYENNIENIDLTIEALKKGKVQEAYDEYLWAIDWAWYDMFFDEETCSYMKNQLFEKREDTWGADLIQYPHADTREVVQSLKAKYDKKNPDLSEEIEMLESIKSQQEEYLKATYDRELEGLKEAVNLMKTYAQ